MTGPAGVTVPPALARQVAAWILAGVRAELVAERDRGGRPFPAAPYVALARALAATSVDGTGPVATIARPMLSTADAARCLHISARRVRQLAVSGALPAHRLGRTWAIDPEGLPR